MQQPKDLTGFSHIEVLGAREHNLKNIDVSIPRNQLVVITGISGSGKSSLAFDTIYAEGQRRYMESFSAYVCEHLPAYARPVFLRIQQELDTTGTFKMVKGDLRKDAYNLDRVSDTLFVLRPRRNTYERLDAKFAAQLNAGEGGY